MICPHQLIEPDAPLLLAEAGLRFLGHNLPLHAEDVAPVSRRENALLEDLLLLQKRVNALDFKSTEAAGSNVKGREAVANPEPD